MIQAAINSDTNEAKMAQYKNQIKEAGIQLMEKLNPSLSALTGWTTKLMKAALSPQAVPLPLTMKDALCAGTLRSMILALAKRRPNG